MTEVVHIVHRQNRQWDAASVSVRNKRRYNEDRSVILLDMPDVLAGGFAVAVFDGHNGEKAAAHAAEHLVTAVVRATAEFGPLTHRIYQAVMKTEADIVGAVPDGATCTIVVGMRAGTAAGKFYLVTVQVGDSLAFALEESGKARSLVTVFDGMDTFRYHKRHGKAAVNKQGAKSADLRRILAAGCSVSDEGRVVCPCAKFAVNMTRSLGDGNVKCGPEPPELQAMSPLPDIRVQEWRSDSGVLVLASDGLNETDSDFKRSLRALAALRTAPSLPESLEAIARRHQVHDNTTIVVLRRSPMLLKLDTTYLSIAMRSEAEVKRSRQELAKFWPGVTAWEPLHARGVSGAGGGRRGEHKARGTGEHAEFAVALLPDTPAPYFASTKASRPAYSLRHQSMEYAFTGAATPEEVWANMDTDVHGFSAILYLLMFSLQENDWRLFRRCVRPAAPSRGFRKWGDWLRSLRALPIASRAPFTITDYLRSPVLPADVRDALASIVFGG